MPHTATVSGSELTLEAGEAVRTQPVGLVGDVYVAQTSPTLERTNAHIPHPVHNLIHQFLVFFNKKSMKPHFDSVSRKKDLSNLSSAHFGYTTPSNKVSSANVTLKIMGRMVDQANSFNMSPEDRKTFNKLAKQYRKLQKTKKYAALKAYTPAQQAPKAVFFTGQQAERIHEKVAPVERRGLSRKTNHYADLNTLLLASMMEPTPPMPKRGAADDYHHKMALTFG
ncbi:MAG: hypothetical protein WC612_06935 [Bdellovibrionales bacterium]|jgi:hypothetical protein